MFRWFIFWSLGFFCLFVCVRGAEASEWTLKIVVDRAEVHLKPDSGSAVVATVPRGEILKSSAREWAWYRVAVDPGRKGVLVIGYLSERDVEVTNTTLGEPDFWPEASGEYGGAGITVRFGGGFLFFPSGDIGKGASGMFESTAAVISSFGDRIEEKNKVPLHSGYDLTGDIIYSLNRKMGIGLRVDYIAASPESTLRFLPGGANSYTMLSRPNLTVISLRPGFYYHRPLNRLLAFLVNGGPVIYFTNYRYNRTFPRLDAEEDIQQKVKATSLGFQGGAGLELRLNERSAIFLEVQGRYARITNLKGEEQSYRLARQQSVGTTVNGYLYYEESGTYPSLAVLEDDSAAARNARRGVLDLSGVSLAAGLRIKF
jgi:hypothetical protein